MWFDFGAEGSIGNILEEAGFSGIKTEKVTISMIAASAAENFRSEDRLRIPCEEIAAVARS